MKVFAVPTVTAGATAGLSVLFFIGISHVFGDRLLGEIILVQASVALIQMVCVPQGWVYLIQASDRDELRARYAQTLTTEVLGIALGFAALAAILAMPFEFTKNWHQGAQLLYCSLVIQASTSTVGWLRATEGWKRYVLWSVTPNLIRVPLIWATPWLVAHGLLPTATPAQVPVIAIYFLAPDLVRFAMIALPIAVANYRWPGIARVISAAKIIRQNWLFDIGSMLTESADKVVVGALLGPHTLVAYFFARRMGIVATMVTEPYYAEHFRRTARISAATERVAQQANIYRRGLLFACILFAAMIVAVGLAMRIPGLERVVPTAVTGAFALFAGVLLVDCLMAANRWSRFVAQLSGGSAELMTVRLGLFAMFALNVWLFGATLDGFGLALAFALSWSLEAGYIAAKLRRASRHAVFTLGRLAQADVERSAE